MRVFPRCCGPCSRTSKTSGTSLAKRLRMDARVEERPVEAAANTPRAPVESATAGGWRNTLWRLAILIAGFGIWEIAARLKWIDPYLISSPNAIAERLWSLARSGAMLGHIYITA